MAARVHAESAQRTSATVTELLRKQPFFGSLALRLPLRADPSRETLASDGHEIRYSPRWIADTDAHVIETAMARVVMACALKHHTRRGERDPERWQHASQLVTHALVRDAGFTLPSDAQAWDGLSVEQAYDRLPEPQDGDSGDDGGAPSGAGDSGTGATAAGQPSGAGDDDGDPSGNPPDSPGGGDLPALAGPGAVAQHPAAPETDRRRQHLAVGGDRRPRRLPAGAWHARNAAGTEPRRPRRPRRRPSRPRRPRRRWRQGRGSWRRVWWRRRGAGRLRAQAEGFRRRRTGRSLPTARGARVPRWLSWSGRDADARVRPPPGRRRAWHSPDWNWVKPPVVRRGRALPRRLTGPDRGRLPRLGAAGTGDAGDQAAAVFGRSAARLRQVLTRWA